MKKEIKLIYVGRRMNGDEITNAFVKKPEDPADKELFFSKIKAHRIGGFYQFFTEDKNYFVSKRPQWLGSAKVAEEAMRHWIARDAVAEEKDRERRLEAGFNKNTELRQDIERLRRHVTKLSYSEMRVLPEFIVKVLFDHQLLEMNRGFAQRLSRAARRVAKAK